MATIERYGEHRDEDWAIRMMANALIDELEPYVSKKNLPYFKAAMRTVADRPEEYRQNGYSVRNMVFFDHEKKGTKLVRCKARFDNFTPSSGGPFGIQVSRSQEAGGRMHTP